MGVGPGIARGCVCVWGGGGGGRLVVCAQGDWSEVVWVGYSFTIFGLWVLGLAVSNINSPNCKLMSPKHYF